MARYGYGSDSVDQYQGTAFDPLTGRLSGGQLVMQVINEMAARKKQKQQEGWEVEDRAIKNDYLKAQAENLRETKPIKEPVQRGYKVPPQTLKEVAAYFKFPESEWDQYDPEMQKDMVTKYLTIKGQRPTAVKPTTTKGTTQIKELESAAKRIYNGGAMYRAILTQLLSNPDKAMLVGDKVNEYQKIVNRYEEAADEIEAMKTRIDENGELDEKDYARLQALLKVPAAIRTGPSASPKKPKSEAETKLPPGFVIK